MGIFREILQKNSEMGIFRGILQKNSEMGIFYIFFIEKFPYRNK